jgi:hypothetical protein
LTAFEGAPITREQLLPTATLKKIAANYDIVEPDHIVRLWSIGREFAEDLLAALREVDDEVKEQHEQKKRETAEKKLQQKEQAVRSKEQARLGEALIHTHIGHMCIAHPLFSCTSSHTGAPSLSSVLCTSFDALAGLSVFSCHRSSICVADHSANQAVFDSDAH